MNRLSLTAVLSLALLAACLDSSRTAHPLEGTWEQLRAEALLADTTIVWNIAERSPQYRPLKIVSSSHFAYLHPNTIGDSLLHAGKGRVEVNQTEKAYTEHIDFHVVPGLTGTSIKFKYRLDGDLWYHIRDDTPVWEAARQHNGDSDTYQHIEIWERKH